MSDLYGCCQKIWIPQNGWFILENYIKMDDLGVPLFLETSILAGSTSIPAPGGPLFKPLGTGFGGSFGVASSSLMIKPGGAWPGWLPGLDIVIWVVPKIMVPQNGWFIMENPIKMDDLGISLFLGNTHIRMLDDTLINIKVYWGWMCQICVIKSYKSTKKVMIHTIYLVVSTNQFEKICS